MELPVIDLVALLRKTPGKGGWTYAVIPADAIKGKSYGMNKMKAVIDDHEVAAISLMPLANGNRFLPLKAEIRKAVGKEAGQSVRIRLFPFEIEFDVAAELMVCLADEPEAEIRYQKLTKTEKDKYIHWISEAATADLRIERIAEAITRIANGQKSPTKV